MEATLTELHRKTKEVVRPVTSAGQAVTVTENGKPVAKIVPVGKPRLLTMESLRLLASVPSAPRSKEPIKKAEAL